MNAAGFEKFAIGAGLLLIVGAVIYVFVRGPGGVAKDAAKGAVDLAKGTVVGIGEGLGVPATDDQKCRAALAAGNTWEASKYCDAGTFIREGVFGLKPPTPPPVTPGPPQPFSSPF